MKVNLLKKECQAASSQYEWRVGKGCFTIGHLSPDKSNKTCAPNEILNPKSKRCDLRSGKIGQALLGKTKKSAAPKPCAPDEIRNPASDRCVKRSGKIGQALLGNQKTRSPIKAQSQFYPKSNDLPCGYMPGFDRYTCMELPLRNIKYIIGPCSFYYFKYRGRNIYLFGEAHLPLERSNTILSKTDIKLSNSIMFAGFVHSLVTQNPTRTYDLMYETPYMFEKAQPEHSRTGTTSSPTLTSIHNMFYDCINPSKRRLCTYPNLRTHYIDYRWTVEGKKVKEMWVNRAQQINEIKKLISTGKVAKQIESIKDPTVRTALDKYIESELRLLPKREHHGLIIMDIYGMARMFREFDKTIDKHNSQFKGTSDNIIYYAGALHIDNMRLFFTSFMGIPESPINVLWDTRDEDGCQSFMKLDVGNKALNFIH